jgi:hypothetical protein
MVAPYFRSVLREIPRRDVSLIWAPFFVLKSRFSHTTTRRQHTLQVDAHRFAPVALAAEAGRSYYIFVYALRVFASGLSAFSAIHVTVPTVVPHQVFPGIQEVGRQSGQPIARRENLEIRVRTGCIFEW